MHSISDSHSSVFLLCIGYILKLWTFLCGIWNFNPISFSQEFYCFPWVISRYSLPSTFEVPSIKFSKSQLKLLSSCRHKTQNSISVQGVGICPKDKSTIKVGLSLSSCCFIYSFRHFEGGRTFPLISRKSRRVLKMYTESRCISSKEL